MISLFPELATKEGRTIDNALIDDPFTISKYDFMIPNYNRYMLNDVYAYYSIHS